MAKTNKIGTKEEDLFQIPGNVGKTVGDGRREEGLSLSPPQRIGQVRGDCSREEGL